MQKRKIFSKQQKLQQINKKVEEIVELNDSIKDIIELSKNSLHDTHYLCSNATNNTEKQNTELTKYLVKQKKKTKIFQNILKILIIIFLVFTFIKFII